LVVTAQAPRVNPLLVAALEHLDDRHVPIAETNRRLGQLAGSIDVPRPSYQQVRVLVHAVRERQEARRAARRAAVDLILDVQFRRRPPDALLELLHGYADGGW
jgi:hypothetical protein